MSKRFKGLPYYQKQESFFAQKLQFDSFLHQSSYFLENILKNYILVISIFDTVKKWLKSRNSKTLKGYRSRLHACIGPKKGAAHTLHSGSL